MSDDPEAATPPPDGDDPGAKPFEDVSSEELDAKAQRFVDDDRIQVWTKTFGETTSVRIDGPCPRCEHHFSDTRVEKLPVSSVRGRHSAAGSVASVTADFACKCRVVHADTPPTDSGCGATFVIEVLTHDS